MKSPITGKDMILRKDRRIIKFRKEEFEVIYHYYLCTDSNEQFTNTQLDELNINQVYNKYRVKYNIPFPDEIIEIRNKYGVSATKMAEILGFGINVYRNYENGEVPNLSNAKLIQLIKDPNEFLRLVQLADNVLEKDKLSKLKHKIQAIIEIDEKREGDLYLQQYLLGELKPDQTTGFKVPDLNKLAEMVIYFAEKLEPWKTKLNKLLFYADFLNYKQYGYALSGVRYRAINMGPVPNNFNSIYDYLANNNLVDIYMTEFEDGHNGDQFKPNSARKFNPELLSQSEIEILNIVSERFKNTSVKEIIDISHNEDAWKANFNNGKKLIDYHYGFDLKAI